MQTQRLGQRQLFNMLRGNLEKRIIKLYSETRDVSAVIEYAVAILVRHSLTVTDFSFICQELIRELFLTAEPSAVLRRFSVFFEDYFAVDEWKSVVVRLYKHKKDYLAATEEARSYKVYLQEKDPTRTDGLADHQFDLKSIFKGANGRKHTWTLRKAHPTKNQEEIVGALKILTMLTIFETNGVRKFTEFVAFSRTATTEDLYYAVEPEEQIESVEEPIEKNTGKTARKRTAPSPQKIQPKPAQKASRKEEVKQKNTAKIPDYEANKDRPVRELINERLLEEGFLPEPDPKTEDTFNDSDSSQKNQQVSSQKPEQSTIGSGKNTKNEFGKSEEQIESERNDRRFRRRLAKIMGKRNKK